MNARTLYPVVLFCAVAWAGITAEARIQVTGPIFDTNAYVRHTTYYYCDPNQGWHGAVDISNGTCSTWNERTMLVGSFYWSVVSNCGSNCQPTPQVCANYAYVTMANGYRFYQYHHNHNAYSYSRTCDRCAIGLIGATGNTYGAQTHAQYNQYSTQLTSWYEGYVTCGSKGSGTIGWL